MCQISISIPDAVLYDTHMQPSEAASFVKKIVAAELYQNRGVSIGYCAQIADMTEEDFLLYLGTRGISVFRPADIHELEEDFANA